MLTKTIDGLFTDTRYGVWGLGLAGIIVSIVLAIVNFSLGISSLCICIGLFLLSIAVALVLLPKSFAKGELLEKRYIAGTIACILAIGIVGIVYFTYGGFPELNLLFV